MPPDPQVSISIASDGREWDDFIRATPDGTFCHLWGWRDVITGTLGHEFVNAVARDASGAIVGALPLTRVRNPIFGHHLTSVLFMNYGGPVGTEAARVALTQWAIDEAKSGGAKSLTLRSRQPVPGEFPRSDGKITVVLPLPATEDELWNKRFNAKFRNKIKRPQRDGMETKFGPEHLDGFYDVWAENMRDLGTPVVPRAFFQRIVTTFPDSALVGVTYWEGRAVAGGFGFVWRDEFEMTWSSSARALRAQKPNMLLYWDYMRVLIARGVTAFNFGRSSPGSGTHEFKQSWGGVDEPLPWIQWPQADGGAGESGVAALASTVWRRLPLPVTNALGPSLARRLPWW